MDTPARQTAIENVRAKAGSDRSSIAAACEQRATVRKRKPNVAVLAVQGAFVEHERRLEQLGCDCTELRHGADLARPFDGLVLPGGESTAQAKLLRDLGMLEPLRTRIASGMPTLGTCAGLILLAERVTADVSTPSLAGSMQDGTASEAAAEGSMTRGAFGTMPITVRRNAYGRQLGSFRTLAPFGDEGEPPCVVAMTFIRAPRIESVRDGTRTLAVVDDVPVAVQAGNQIGCAFHPELEDSNVVYERFLALVEGVRTAD